MRDRLGLNKRQASGSLASLDNPNMEELGTNSYQEMSRTSWAILGTNRDFPDVTHRVAIGEIPPKEIEIQQALAEAKRPMDSNTTCHHRLGRRPMG